MSGVTNWRKVFSWKIPEIFNSLISPEDLPQPQGEVTSLTTVPDEEADALLKSMYITPDNVGYSYIWRLLKKIKEEPDTQTLLSEIGLGKIRAALERGLLNITEDRVLLSQKGEQLYNVITTHILGKKDTIVNTRKSFRDIYNKLLKIISTIDATTLVSFFRAPKITANRWERPTTYDILVGKLSPKFITYIKQLEEYFQNTYGVSLASTIFKYYDSISSKELAEVIIDRSLRKYYYDHSIYITVKERYPNVIFDNERDKYNRALLFNYNGFLKICEAKFKRGTNPRRASQTLSWQRVEEGPKTVAYAVEPTITERGRTHARYCEVIFENDKFLVDLGNDRGSYRTETYVNIHDARQRFDDFMSIVGIADIEWEHWEDYYE